MAPNMVAGGTHSQSTTVSAGEEDEYQIEERGDGEECQEQKSMSEECEEKGKARFKLERSGERLRNVKRREE